MTTKFIRIAGFVLPALGWLLILALRRDLTAHAPAIVEALAEVAIVTVAGVVFTTWIAARFEKHEREAELRASQLESLRQAAITLTTEVELHQVLQKVADLSRALSGARYAALGVMDASGTRVDRLYTSGISDELRARMGEVPHGHGLLGAIMSERRPMRVDAIDHDPRSAGFSSHHPHMKTLLGVPIMSKGAVFGNLYLTDKIDSGTDEPQPFEESDQRTLEMFAAHAAVAIENARLHGQAQQVAIMQERERFGMNLHDGVIQSIYAVGLMLEDAQHRMESEPALARERIGAALKGLNHVIGDIRSYILDLQPHRFEGRSLHESLKEIAGAVQERGELELALHIDGRTAAIATPQQTTEVIHVVQEALTNIQKHADASHAALHVRREGDHMLLEIEDDGQGFDVFRAASRTSGHGLRNMQERARALNGELEIDSEPGRGTRISLSVPLPLRALVAAND